MRFFLYNPAKDTYSLLTWITQEFYEDNVQYIEVRSTLPENICRNMDSRNCDPLTSAEVAQVFVDVAVAFENTHPGNVKIVENLMLFDKDSKI